MKLNFYTDSDSATPCCIVCKRQILNDTWFARFPFRDRRVVVCRPYCLESFLDDQAAYAAKLGSIRFLETSAVF